MRFFRIIGKITVGAFLLGIVVMLLWNALVPYLFGLPFITYLQAVGLLILSRLLFGKWGGARGRGGCHHHHGGCGTNGQSRREHWRQKFAAKMQSMSEEDREAFKKQFRGRCGNWGSHFWGHHAQEQQSQQEQQDQQQHGDDAPEDKF
ncbi:MAG: hypothetical protein H6581_26435 [Bacteroidia bacterium]|nr:hypothetical protein [Bacteroidia bacterium]